MKRFFITGTDTDCGKTYVTCALLDQYKQNNITAVAVKPVASGCVYIDNMLVSEDAMQLQKHNHFPVQNINPWRFEMPVSPHIASHFEEKPLSIQEIADYCMNFEASPASHLLIEGAGGLMVPLTNSGFWTDVLQITKIPVILVVGIRTGCINHALLTQQALKTMGIEFAGWIANEMTLGVLAFDENVETLKRRLEAPLMRVIRNGDFQS